ncbi:MAG: transcription initiation protein [Bacteroidetes bacterium]|nr:transcription initiation protein [Bacteroidota bacterium]
MKEYLLLYRMDMTTIPARTEEQAAQTMQLWMDWIGGIAAKGQLVSRGSRLEASGRVLRSGNVITNGPYTDIKEVLGGYSLIKAAGYDEALELAGGCPVLQMGGSVEVREQVVMQ